MADDWDLKNAQVTSMARVRKPNMRPTKDEWALKLALVTAQRATCTLKQVGCVLLNARGHVLATGYNGTAASLPHCEHPPAPVCQVCRKPLPWYKDRYSEVCSYCSSWTFLDTDTIQLPGTCEVIHAEQNSLLQCRNVYDIDSAYVTAEPCVTCAKLLLNTSCQRIVFKEKYPTSDGLDLWAKAGRIWLCMPDMSL